MAHFQGGIQGNRGLATRLGTSRSGIYAFARGWGGGARLDLWEQDGKDWIRIAVGPHHNTNLLTVYRGPIAKVLQIADNCALYIE